MNYHVKIVIKLMLRLFTSDNMGEIMMIIHIFNIYMTKAFISDENKINYSLYNKLYTLSIY